MTKRRQRGEGSLYQRSDGMWMGMVDLGWRDGRRVRRQVSSRDYKTARRKLADLKKTIDQHGDVPDQTMTVEKWLTYWLDNIAAGRLKPSTLRGYRSKVDTLLIPEIGRVKLDQLRPAHLRDAYARMGDGRSSTSVLQAHAIMRKALNDAMREERVTRNVATLLDAPRKAASNRRALTTNQARALLSSVADDPMGSRYAMALLTGARQGEVLGLTWDRVDLDAGTLEVSWALQRLDYRHGCGKPATCGRKRAGSCPDRELDVRPDFEYHRLDGGLCMIRPKSKAGWRVVPVVAPLEAALRRRAELAEGQPNPHNLVWTRPDGRPIDPSDDSAAWHAALDAAGLPPAKIHEARNTAATLLHEAGVDGHTVRQIMGHSSVTTTRGYQHVDVSLSRDGLRRMVDMLELEG